MGCYADFVFRKLMSRQLQDLGLGAVEGGAVSQTHTAATEGGLLQRAAGQSCWLHTVDLRDLGDRMLPCASPSTPLEGAQNRLDAGQVLRPTP